MWLTFWIMCITGLSWSSCLVAPDFGLCKIEISVWNVEWFFKVHDYWLLGRAKINGFQTGRSTKALSKSKINSRFSSNSSLKFWWWVLGTMNHQFCTKDLKSIDFCQPYWLLEQIQACIGSGCVSLLARVRIKMRVTFTN
jgi:hypothetical protein